MALIKLKRGTTAGFIPDGLTFGEAAVNTTDGILYCGNTLGETVDMSGVLSFNGKTGHVLFSEIDDDLTMNVTGLSASSGITSSGTITAISAGDVVLNLIADTDNSGEDDNPIISMGQDGDEGNFTLGIVGNAGQIFTNSLSNAAFLSTKHAHNDLQFAVDDDMKMTILDTGKVGIGTNTPATTLEVIGETGISAGGNLHVGKTATFLNGITATGLSNINGLVFEGNGIYDSPNGFNFGLGDDNIHVKFRLTGFSLNDTGSDIDTIVLGNTDDNLLRVDASADRVGIGVQTPQEKLDVNGTIQASGGISAGGELHIGATAHFDGNITLLNNTTFGIDGDEKITFNTSRIEANTDDFQTRQKISHLGDTDTLIEFTTDKIGFEAGGVEFMSSVGTGGVNFPVGLSAAAGITANTTLSVGSTGTFLSDVLIDGGTDGDAKLIIRADTDNNDENDNPLIRLEQDGGVVSTSIGMVGDADGQFSGALANMFYIEADGSAGDFTHGIQFATANNARMTIDAVGNIGINEKSPAQKLDVNGTISTNGISCDGNLAVEGTTNFLDNNVSRSNLKDYSEHVNAIGTITGNTAVNFENGNVQTVTVNGNCEFSFTNPPASGKAGTITLVITNGGSATVTFASAIKWPSDVAPSLTSSGVDVLSFLTTDGGSNIFGFVGGLNFS